jgi:ABC-type spermidine/putrescine transport system permease subunit I
MPGSQKAIESKLKSMRPVRHMGSYPFWMLMPSLLLLFVFLGIPIVIVAVTSLEPNVLLKFKGPALNNYVYLSTKSYYADVLLRTARIASTSALVAVPLGYTLAYFLRDLSGRLGNLAIMGLTVPILAGPLVIVIGWMALLANGGPLFGPLVRWGLITKPQLIGSETGVVITLVQFILPFVVLTLYTSLRQIPSQILEAASSLGASATQKFIHVTLPMTMSGVLSATIIAFSLGASSYVSPYYIGGPSQLTLTTLIGEFTMTTFNSQLAAASAILLLVMMLGLIFALITLGKRLARI